MFKQLYKFSLKKTIDYSNTNSEILKDTISFLSKNQITVLINNQIYADTENNTLLLYIINDFHKLVPIATVDLQGKLNYPNHVTDYTKTTKVTIIELNREINEFINGIYYVTNILKELIPDGKIDSLKSNKSAKIRKEKYSTKIILKNKKMDIKYYKPAMSDINYKIQDNSVEMLFQTPDKRIITVPSKEYKLPNNNDIHVFEKNNTKDITDNSISKILSVESFLIGHCYQNSELIYDKLINNGFDVEYYCGWLIKYGNLTHHAWIVVNGESIIDAGILKNEDELLNNSSKFFINSSKCKDMDSARNLIVDNAIIAMKSDKEFKVKYQFGAVPDRTFYIGVKSNKLQAINSAPVSKNTTINATQALFYKKFIDTGIN